MTYSIVARDPVTGDLGVAVQSHFFAAAGLVCWAKPGIGAVASQAFADPIYGALGLELMSRDVGAPEALRALLGIDSKQEFRQVAMVDVNGTMAAHTGPRCIPHAGHAMAAGVGAQGNMLREDRIWDGMLVAYHHTEGDLADRLMSALEAAEAAGGDIRGRQAAGIQIVSGERGNRPWEGVKLDLRVEDHPEPVKELRRLVLYKRSFDLVAKVIFAEGLILGEYREPEEGALEAAIRDLEAAARELQENAEPDLWLTILLARAGRAPEAADALAVAAAKNPALVDFVRRLPEAGFLAADNALLRNLE